MEENKKPVEEISEESTEQVSGGYSQRYKDKSGKFKVRFRDRILGYKSRDIYCDFCGRKFTTEGIFKIKGKDACINCYKRLSDGSKMEFSDAQILGK